jgi:hypothetical protein
VQQFSGNLDQIVAPAMRVHRPEIATRARQAGVDTIGRRNASSGLPLVHDPVA